MECLSRQASTKCVDAAWNSQHERGGKMKSILDPSFHYTTSVETDLRTTFARVRRELLKQQQEQATANVQVVRKVLPLHARKAGP